MEYSKRLGDATPVNPHGNGTQQGISHEQIAEDRLWNKRPDGIAFKMPTDTESGVICLLEFKRMSDVTSHYIVRVQNVTMTQYESL